MLDRLKSKVRELFFSQSITVDRTLDRPVGKKIVKGMLSALQQISRFDTLDPFDTYENIYAYEPEIGGAIDRLSSFVAQSYRGFTLKNAGDTLEDDEARLLELAQKIDEHYNFKDLYEVLAELLLIHGNVYIHVRKSRSGFPSLRILPNKYVTIVDSKERINNMSTAVAITSAKYYIVNEALDSQFIQTEVIPASEIIHIKYKDTPVFMRDKFGRLTYGIYSISPLMRSIFPVWFKRQAMITDIMWRYRNVPREHHVISSQQFDLRNYSGTIQERLQQAKLDAERLIEEYAKMLEEQEPDHGYVTLDTVNIRKIDASAGKYAEPNALIEQMSDYMLMALNIPQSIVRGMTKGSYASEIAQMSYLSSKVLRIAEKIKHALLEFTRQLIVKIDETLPVEKLDMKLELILETNRMEQFRMAAIMADLGAFTTNEIRKFLGYSEIPDLADQLHVRDKTRKAGSKSVSDVVADVKKSTGPAEPVTPQSREDTLKPN